MNAGSHIPIDFLKAEIRCGYQVSENTKKLWACELNLLEQIIRICRKHNIKYFMLAGSLLGAMRHRGFIPWDDDIDIGMLRQDYDKFIGVAHQELSYPYFLQSINTEPECLTDFAKLRNSNTTAIFDCWIYAHHTHVNQGVFVDIFPVDGIPKHAMQYKMLSMLRWILGHIRHRAVYCQSKRCARRIFNFFCKMIVGAIGYQRFCRLIDGSYRVCSVRGSGKCGLMCWPGAVLKRFQWRSDIFNELIEVPFEHLSVSVPKDYDECLRQSYGDWHKLVKGGSCHEGTLYDVDRPYTEYLLHDFGYTKDEIALSHKC